MPEPIYPHARWERLVAEVFLHIKEFGEKKGAEYSGDTDRLLNFRRNGKALDLPMEVIWAVYAAKHWDALIQYIQDIKNNKTRSRLENIEGRVDDLITYLILFRAMLEERNGYVENKENGNAI